ARMCGVLGMEGRSVAVNQRGEIDLATLEQEIARGGVGTVVLTAGTTGYGVVDDVEAVVRLRQRYDFRIHIDAAYGGFFRVLQGQPLDDAVYRRLLAIRECDSVVVDPHKHGLQPYGCGAVLLRDPRVGRFYRHDSPYTYFTSDELHLGEISLECSRAGAAAGALWLTLKLLPLAAHHGFGPILKATLRAAQRLAAAIEKSKAFVLYREPQLDVVTFYPRADRASEVDALSSALLKHLMRDTDDPVFLSLLKVDASDLTHKGVTADVPEVRILRSVLMKPEHEHVAGSLFGRLTDELNRMRPNGSV
ncbi:MAG: pyridoxal-dependent decarboxylase, partial [Bacteroidota bacterium]